MIRESFKEDRRMGRHTRNDIVKHYLYAYFKEEKKWKEILLTGEPYGYVFMQCKRASYVVPGEYGLLIEVWGEEQKRTAGQNNEEPIYQDMIPYNRISIEPGTGEPIIEVEKNGALVRTKLRHFLMPTNTQNGGQPNGRH